MKKLLIGLCIVVGLYSCAKKEELAPDLTSTEKLEIPLTSFQRLQDSPTCVVPQQNYVSIVTARSLVNDYGIFGNLDVSSSAMSAYFGVSNYVRLSDYYGNGNLLIDFGDYNYPQTGIYYTNTSGYISEYDDHKRYIEIYIENRDPWNNSFPEAMVKPNQRVLVVISKDGTQARIKFCDAELDLLNNNTGTISADLLIDID